MTPSMVKTEATSVYIYIYNGRGGTYRGMRAASTAAVTSAASAAVYLVRMEAATRPTSEYGVALREKGRRQKTTRDVAGEG